MVGGALATRVTSIHVDIATSAEEHVKELLGRELVVVPLMVTSGCRVAAAMVLRAARRLVRLGRERLRIGVVVLSLLRVTEDGERFADGYFLCSIRTRKNEDMRRKAEATYI